MKMVILAGAVVFIVPIAIGGFAPAGLSEDLLVRENGAEYRGFKKDDGSFVTCNKSVIKLKRGDVVQPAAKKCGRPDGGTPSPRYRTAQ